MNVALKVIADCCNITERSAKDWVKSGLFIRKSRGQYDLISNVRAYWKKKMEASAGTDHKAVKLEQDKLKNKLMEIQIEENEGRLVSREDIEREVAGAARHTRDAVFNLIPRTVPLLAAESDPSKIQSILNTEIRKALEETKKYLETEDE